jgi:hypothetical protein
MRLAEFQTRFQAAILDPKPLALANLGLKAVPDKRARFAVHRRQFWRRMRSYSGSRYPLLVQLLGDDEFDLLVRQYIGAFSSRSFNPAEIVQGLSDFLAEQSPWAEFPIIAHLAAFDFRRSATKLGAEELTLRAEELVGLGLAALARVELRLKKRAMLTTTRYRFNLSRIADLPRDATLDDKPTHWLIDTTGRACRTRPVDARTFGALERISRGVTVATLVGELKAAGFAFPEIDNFVSRCIHQELLVATSIGRGPFRDGAA